VSLLLASPYLESFQVESRQPPLPEPPLRVFVGIRPSRCWLFLPGEDWLFFCGDGDGGDYWPSLLDYMERRDLTFKEDKR